MVRNLWGRLYGPFDCRLRRTGQSLSEYGLVVALVAIAAIGTVQVLGEQVNAIMGEINNTLVSNSKALVASNPGPSLQSSLVNGPGIPAGISDNVSVAGGNTGEQSEIPMNESNQTTNPSSSTRPDSTPSASNPSPGSAADDPRYQQWLAANPQTATLINQLSPQGQQAAYEALSQFATSNNPPNKGIWNTLASSGKLSPADSQIINAYRASLAATVAE